MEAPELYHKGDIVTPGHGYDIGIVAEDATPEKVKIYAQKVEPCFESLYGGTANPTFSYGCKWYSTGIHATLEEWNKMSEVFWDYNKYKDIEDDRDKR